MGLFSSKCNGSSCCKDTHSSGSTSINQDSRNVIVKAHFDLNKASASPFVTERMSSMFVDEDGDEAHEFYKESRTKGRPKLIRIVHNLKPQGLIKYDIPKLHPDLPCIMCHVHEKMTK